MEEEDGAFWKLEDQSLDDPDLKNEDVKAEDMSEG